MRITENPRAAARIIGGREAPNLRGTVRFYPMWDGVLVEVEVCGLPEGGDGIFAMHIHEGSDCGGTDFSNAGGHFNPGGQMHPEHAGDLPPLFRCCGGRAYFAMVTSRFTIPDVVGRTVIIHSGPDDFHSQPAGNSGSRIGCGMIRRI